VVECDLAKVEVAGSNPVSRSIFLWRHSQVVRQRSAKPPFSGSNPDAASRSNLKACGMILFRRAFLFAGDGTFLPSIIFLEFSPQDPVL
jgi:hypothetical protein